MKKNSIIILNLLQLSQFLTGKYYLVKIGDHKKKKTLEVAKQKSDLMDFISGGRNADIQEIKSPLLSCHNNSS